MYQKLVLLALPLFALWGCSQETGMTSASLDPLTRSVEQEFDSSKLQLPAGDRSDWVLIHNSRGGRIVGSHDQGKTWELLGHILVPIQGGIWRPTEEAGVLAFNFLRGPSNVFASAVNAIHLRFSDPQGYQLPEDPEAPLMAPHGVSLVPQEELTRIAGDESSSSIDGGRTGITDIPGGTGFFGAEWSPKVGSQVYMGDGTQFAPIPYNVAPHSDYPDRSYLLIVTPVAEREIEYVEFENKVDGRVMLKRVLEEPAQVAKVKRPVEGIGRFSGSEYIQKPGVLRANHPGVICIGTTDINTDPDLQNTKIPTEQINELRGGFQVVPSHHFQDPSMQNGFDHPFVYLVVGPVQEPAHLKRYDMGIEGTFPLFYQGLRGGLGRTELQFRGDDRWLEISEAVQAGKFKTRNGTVLRHLRGYIKDALVEVTAIRFYNAQPTGTQ
jgi:hypothetical protein